MDCESSAELSAGELSLEEAARGFALLAAEYRRVAACVAGVAEACDAAGVPRNQVLDIAFGSAVRRIGEGADLLDSVAGRFREAADGEAAAAAAAGFSMKAEIDGAGASGLAAEVGFCGPTVHLRPCASLDDAPRALAAAARALEDAMLRALDLVDEVARPDLAGDSHPFGHIIHGICVPYLLLAAEDLEGLVASGRLGK